jgi:hypothetical protein
MMLPSARNLATRTVFYERVGRSGAISITLVGTTLVVGTIGYVFFANLAWVDAFHQAALLMSGMGPLNEDHWSVSAKLFDSVYALFCGVVLLVSYGVLFAPILHRFMHKFHLEDVRSE